MEPAPMPSCPLPLALRAGFLTPAPSRSHHAFLPAPRHSPTPCLPCDLAGMPFSGGFLLFLWKEGGLPCAQGRLLA